MKKLNKLNRRNMAKGELAKLSKFDDFGEIIKKRLAEKYADDAIQLMKEAKKIEKAHNQYQKWVAEIENGNLEVIEEYKQRRAELDNEEDYDF